MREEKSKNMYESNFYQNLEVGGKKPVFTTKFGGCFIKFLYNVVQEM